MIFYSILNGNRKKIYEEIKRYISRIKIEIDDYLTKRYISVDPISISRFYLSSVKYHRPC
jgi:hypothetical protein